MCHLLFQALMVRVGQGGQGGREVQGCHHHHLVLVVQYFPRGKKDSYSLKVIKQKDSQGWLILDGHVEKSDSNKRCFLMSLLTGLFIVSFINGFYKKQPLMKSCFCYTLMIFNIKRTDFFWMLYWVAWCRAMFWTLCIVLYPFALLATCSGWSLCTWEALQKQTYLL